MTTLNDLPKEEKIELMSAVISVIRSFASKEGFVFRHSSYATTTYKEWNLRLYLTAGWYCYTVNIEAEKDFRSSYRESDIPHGPHNLKLCAESINVEKEVKILTRKFECMKQVLDRKDRCRTVPIKVVF